MIGRSRKPGVGFPAMVPEDVRAPKYLKPKILLIDIKDDSEAVLRNSGFNVSSGTFGTPYRVKKSDSYQAIIPNAHLRDCEEQEIVILDLVARKALDGPIGEKVTSEGENDWWGKCSMGVIDPRPRIMALHQISFDRILAHGGVFVVLADERERQQMLLGYKDNYGL